MLSGNGGADLFTFTAGTSLDNANNAEVITDWNGANDSIHITGVATNGSAAGAFFKGDTTSASSIGLGVAQANTDMQANANSHYIALKVGGDVVVYIDTDNNGSITAADDAIVLQGKSLSDVTGGNFI